MNPLLTVNFPPTKLINYYVINYARELFLSHRLAVWLDKNAALTIITTVKLDIDRYAYVCRNIPTARKYIKEL